MSPREIAIAFRTLLAKEIKRFLRIWVQTLLPPVITTALYFVIFGKLIGTRIGVIDGVPYIDYIVPGVIMMSVITSAYANVVSSFYGARFQHNIEEMLVSPMPNSIILLGFVAGGVARGLVVALLVTLVALGFTHLHVQHLFTAAAMILLTATLFSLAGFSNGLFARSFDDVSIVPTFVLTPLTYLGGVFYSVHMLPPLWQGLSHANPILYMINAFRYGFLGVSDIRVGVSFALVAAAIAVLFGANLYLLERGRGIRT